MRLRMGFLLIILTSFIVCCGCRSDSPTETDKEKSTPPPANQNLGVHWTHMRSDVREKILKQRVNLSPEQKEKMEALEGLGYLAGYQKKTGRQNVTVYDQKKAYNGYNLYISGHAPEAILIDMNGKTLHKWQSPQNVTVRDSESSTYWRKVHLFPNGDLLAMFSGSSLIKMDKDSKLIWVYDNVTHHDMHVMDDGSIYVLTHHSVSRPEYQGGKPFLEDFICELAPDGKERRCVSILKSLEISDYAPYLRYVNWTRDDPFHTNSVEIVDSRMANASPAIRSGNMLISICHLDLVCVVDMEKEKVVWALTGLWNNQHDPTILKNGNMLVYDNLGLKEVRSKVIEMNPFTQQIIWQYKGTKENPFFSFAIGVSYRLPNGNTLIIESTAGRVFEVTKDKEIVWEFISPHHPKGKEDIVGTLFDVVRVPKKYTSSWLSN